MGEARRTGKKLSQRLPPVLGPDFFDRNADAVARDLIGKALVREHAGTRTCYMITETRMSTIGSPGAGLPTSAGSHRTRLHISPW